MQHCPAASRESALFSDKLCGWQPALLMQHIHYTLVDPGGSEASGSDLGIWAFSCLVDSYLEGNGVLGMDLVDEQAAERPSGPPGDIGFCSGQLCISSRIQGL